MRTARGSRTCAQIGSAGRGGASTALIASGSAARQKTRAQTDPRTRSARMRRCSGGAVGGARLPRAPRRGDEHWRAAPTGAASTAARARCGGRGETPSPWYGLRMTWPACGRTCWLPSKDQRGSSKMRGGLQKMIKGGRADDARSRVGPVRAARRRRRRLPDARRVRRADRSEVPGGNEGPPLGSVVKFYP